VNGVVSGSEEERATLQRANRFFNVPPVYDDGDGVGYVLLCNTSLYVSIRPRDRYSRPSFEQYLNTSWKHPYWSRF